MHTELILTLLTLSALATYAVVLYNSLVALKHNVAQAWSNIDVLLKQRHDELPKLVTLARQYMAFEQETLDRVIHARAAVFSACENGDVSKVGAAEHLLQQGMGKFFAVAEQYPALKADENFRHLRERVTGLENTIADRREYRRRRARHPAAEGLEEDDPDAASVRTGRA